jgi:DNA-binding HxlR family transcriptional regulator
MLGSNYDNQTCSVARTLEVVGERWTLLILRNAFLGIKRFEDMQRNLGVARNVLTARLERLVDEGLFERRAYQERPLRHEYVLTQKGRDLWPVIDSLMAWGDEYAPEPAGPPTVVRHRDCGGLLGKFRICTKCGAHVISPFDAQAEAGPGASPDHPLLARA